ncbi:MAG TPA: acyl-CoA thioesterase [Deltaproteobacteria bacterium]|nr:acyl-CoA thioesterase [Deltaproteobacteria bacterium]HPR54940.1 acyl-CoA thioesterase [Deltaproteobacteria bacterium]HXK47773.1 acyl-CoA thioesterase [Deltaproteobacteria bacterium]
MQGKKVSESMVLMAQLMTPEDANPAGNVHGGVIMKLIDNAGGTVAARHARSNVVTATIDRLNFHNPVYIGNLVTLKASINMVGTTSMEVGVRVEAENLLTGEVRHTASAYLTYVSLDSNSRPRKIPPLVVENNEQARRFQEAQARRELRQQERQREAARQKKEERQGDG